MSRETLCGRPEDERVGLLGIWLAQSRLCATQMSLVLFLGGSRGFKYHCVHDACKLGNHRSEFSEMF